MQPTQIISSLNSPRDVLCAQHVTCYFLQGFHMEVLYRTGMVMTSVASGRQEISCNGADSFCPLAAEQITALASSSFILHE
jgi:hypothetical protein